MHANEQTYSHLALGIDIAIGIDKCSRGEREREREYRNNKTNVAMITTTGIVYDVCCMLYSSTYTCTRYWLGMVKPKSSSIHGFCVNSKS